jgi:exopolysaccharide biosynthesis predicted pyruvyltransferase EpsI
MRIFVQESLHASLSKIRQKVISYNHIIMKESDPKKYLSKYKDTNVDFFRFPGNYGDSLIWHGTKKLLLSLNISEHYVDISSPKYNEILFIDGGGNLVDYYSDVRDFLIKKPSLYKEVVVLPHTIFGEKQAEILNSVSSKLTIFCREKVSAEFLEDKLKQAEIYLWHDCAFYNEFVQVPGGNGVINAFRSDIESLSNIQPESNNDLSYDGYATKPLDELIGILQKCAQVNTDRLHIAIAATLLGKKVKLFPNSYYKNKAVFEYSLKRFSNVNFVEDFNNQ